MQLPDHNVKEAINFAVEIADKLESEGCAPWQDAPAQPEPFGPDADARREAACKESLNPALPTRREITAADVQPGAVFTLEDGTKHTVTELTTGAIGGSFVRTSTGSANYEVRGKILEPSVGVFVLQMNAANATVTPPTA